MCLVHSRRTARPMARPWARRLDGHLAFHATAAVRCSRETSSVVASQSSSRRVHLGAKLVKSGHRTSWIVIRVSCACAAISHIRVRLSRCKAHASWYECSPHTPQVRQRVPFPHAPLRLARLYEIVIVIVIVTDPRGTLAPRPFGCSPLAGTGTGLLTGGAARFRPRVMHRACGADPVCRQRRAAPSVARHADLGTLIVQHGTSRTRPARG